MNVGIVAMMLGVSLLLGFMGLMALLWGLKTGQFDDENKFLNAALYDGVEELQDAYEMEKRQKEAKKKK